jgi:hypothetical protein
VKKYPVFGLLNSLSVGIVVHLPARIRAAEPGPLRVGSEMLDEREIAMSQTDKPSLHQGSLSATKIYTGSDAPDTSGDTASPANGSLYVQRDPTGAAPQPDVGIFGYAPAYTPSGMTTVPAGWRPLAGGEVVNVRRFGALGDGSTDDSSAFQAAFDAVAAAGGGVVWVPQGVYMIRHIQVSNASGITWAGSHGAVIRAPGLASPGWDSIAHFEACTDLVVHNLTFDNWQIDRFGGVEFYDVQRVWIDHCRFYNSNVTANAGDKDRRSFFFYETGAGIPNADIWVTDCLIEDLQLEVHVARGVQIRGNTVRRSPVTGGILCCLLNASTSPVEDVWVCDNLVEDPDGVGIYLVMDGTQYNDGVYRGLHVNGNRIKLGLVPDALNMAQASARAIEIGTGNNGASASGSILHDFEVCNNTVWVTAASAALTLQHGILVNNSAAAGWDIARGRIEGNVLFGNGTGTGIDVRQCSTVEVRDNQVSDFSAGIGFVAIAGGRVEGNAVGSINLYPSPSSPANQTVTLAVGSYRVWLAGAGSVTAAAGSATGSGFGAATEAAPITIVITVAGTVTFTVAGVVTLAGVETLVTTAYSFNLNSSTGYNVFQKNKVIGSPLNRYTLAGSGTTGDVVEQEWIVLPASVATGGLLYGSAANTLSALAIGAAGKLLRSNGTLPLYSTATYPDTFAAGDLPYASAANALGSLAIGAANRVLTSSGSAPQWSANLAAAALPVGASSTVTWDVGSGSTLAFTRQVRINAPVSLGNSPDSTTAFRANLALTGGVNQTGILSDATPGSDATASFNAVAVLARTAAAAYTTAAVAGVFVRDAAKGAGSTITTLIGVDVADQTAGGTNLSIRTGTAQCRFGGVGIFGSNATTPNAAAVLQLESTTQGLLLPRMTTTQRNAISSPPDGLLIYNTTSSAVEARVAGGWTPL